MCADEACGVSGAMHSGSRPSRWLVSWMPVNGFPPDDPEGQICKNGGCIYEYCLCVVPPGYRQSSLLSAVKMLRCCVHCQQLASAQTLIVTPVSTLHLKAHLACSHSGSPTVKLRCPAICEHSCACCACGRGNKNERDRLYILKSSHRKNTTTRNTHPCLSPLHFPTHIYLFPPHLP